METKQTGLTLVELMITMAVAITLLAIGIPSFSGIVGSNRATTQANELVAALKLARSEAVKRADFVNVCAGDGSACGGADDWTGGWFVHSDVDGSGGLNTGDVLRSWAPVSSRSTVAVTGGTLVTFGPAGDVTTASIDTFELNNAEASGSAGDAAKRCVTVTASGQVRTYRGACS